MMKKDVIIKVILLFLTILFLFEINSIVFFVGAFFVLWIPILFFFFLFFFLRKKPKINSYLKVINLYLFALWLSSLFVLLIYTSAGIEKVLFCILFASSIIFIFYKEAQINKNMNKKIKIIIISICLFVLLIMVINESFYKANTSPAILKNVFIFTVDDIGLTLGDFEKLNRLENLLNEYNISGTFFVPSKVLEESLWQERLKELGKNHEIAFHGCSHNLFEFGSLFYFIPLPSLNKQEKCFENIKKYEEILNISQIGFRPPAWHENIFTSQIISKRNISYLAGKPNFLTSKPFYRLYQDAKILNLPNSGEFIYFLIGKYEKEIRAIFIKRLINKHLKDKTPIIFVVHLQRLKEDKLFELIEETLTYINDKNIKSITLKEYETSKNL